MKSSKIAPTTTPVEIENKPLMNLGGVYAYAETHLEFVANNPKRSSGKAHSRFENYSKAKTVSEAIALGATKADLRYDFDHKFVAIV
jgi:hypothetical protein